MSQTKAEHTRAELRSIRDTVESIGVAIILAFVLRAFWIEAFVIPTGSMAPRLMGQHWQVQCPVCGYEYAYGLPKEERGVLGRRTAHVPEGATCPNCGYRFADSDRRLYFDNGDRVLVMKYLYRLREPRPWDVVVFKNPQNNRENYIKRLIGLPGETIEIVGGNVFVGASRHGPFRIRRKPARVQEAMWQVVYDNDYQPDGRKLPAGRAPAWWPPQSGRWGPPDCGGRRFRYRGGEPGRLALDTREVTFLPRYGYNRDGNSRRDWDEAKDVCTDLRLSFTFVPKDASARAAAVLSAYGHWFRGELCADGAVALAYHGPAASGMPGWRPWVAGRVAPLRAGCGVDVALVHVDFAVQLWVDGRKVLEAPEGEYPLSYDSLKRLMLGPERVDRPDVQVEASGGPADLLHLQVMRDVYYTTPTIDVDEVDWASVGRNGQEYLRSRGLSPNGGGRIPGWATTGHPIVLAEHRDEPDLAEFFVLGDNSPQSLDGRSWTTVAPTLRLTDARGGPVYQFGTVPRYNLIGKAVFVYWPAGYHLAGQPLLPIVPNVGKMRLIR